MFHVLAFYTNDLASGAANVALGAITDQVVPIQNSRYQVTQDWTVFAHYTGIPDCTGIRINAPSLRRVSLPYLDPISLTALPGNVPPINFPGEMGPRLERTEELTVEASRAVVAAADAYSILFVRDRYTQPTPGPIFTVQATTAIAITEGTWTAGNLTLTQNLPAGKYEIVGMSSYGTNLLASRIAFTGGGYRPGVIAQSAQGEWNNDQFRNGKAGRFGVFEQNVQPLIECLGVGAGAAQIHYLDLVKVG